MKLGGKNTDQTINDGSNNTQVTGDYTLNGITFEEHKKAIAEKDVKIEKLIEEKTRALQSAELSSDAIASLTQELNELRDQHAALRKMIQDPVTAYREHKERETQIGNVLCDIGSYNALGHSRIQAALDDFNALEYQTVDDLFAEQERQGILIAFKSAMGRGLNAENAVRWHDAYAHYKRAYDLTGDIEALRGYARMAWHLGKHQQSLELCETQLSHAKVTYGEESEQVATTLNNLGILHQNLGQFDEAEPLYHQAIEIARKTIGEDHPYFARQLNNLAALYEDMGRYAEAEPLYHQAIEFGRRTSGEDHPDFATRLNNLAGLYQAMGRYKEAEPLYHQAIEIDRKTLGEDHPNFAKRLNNIGFLYYSQERFSEAAPLLKQALAIREAKLPEGHADTEGTRQSLENLYAKHPELRD